MRSNPAYVDMLKDPFGSVATKLGLSDQSTRLLIIALFAINIFAFFIFIAHHPLHNHGLRMPWVNPNDQFHHGRWFTPLVFRFAYSADSPVFLPVMSIAVNIAAALVALRIWRFDLAPGEQFVVAALITTCPVFLAPFYYTWSTPIMLLGSAFAVFAVYFGRSLNIQGVATGAIFVLLAMATYQPSLSVFATLAASSLIAHFLTDKDASWSGHFSRVLSLLISGLVGGVAYLVSVHVTGASSHATSTISLSDLPDRLSKVIDASFLHLTLTQPELLSTVKTVLLVLLVVALALAAFRLRTTLPRMALVLAYALGLVVATKAMFFVSSDGGFFTYRYNLSMAFMYAFAPAVILHLVPRGALRSIVLLLSVCVLIRFTQADLVRQEVLLRGQQHDLALANRILARMEGLPEVDFSKTYDLVRVGKYSTFRQNLLASRGEKAATIGDSHMDNGEITDRWADEDVMILLGSKIQFRHRQFDAEFLTKVDELKPILSKRQPWPHADSVFVFEDKIVVYMQCGVVHGSGC
ncbi:MAG: glucosyltransferase domain-containing protein [Pseudomonadota bacterium]